MSATPASANLPPGLTTIAAKLFPGSTDMDTANNGANGTDLFAVHFQRLLGQQLAVGVDNGQMPITPAVENVPATELAALLPFIEALGLAQTAAEPLGTTDPLTAADSRTTRVPMSAAHLTTDARPHAAAAHQLATANHPAAVIPPTVADQLPGADPLLAADSPAAVDPLMTENPTGAEPPVMDATASIDASTSLPFVPLTPPAANIPASTPAISAAHASPQGQAHGAAFEVTTQPVTTDGVAEALPNTIAGNGKPAEELSAGREFSRQLVAVIAASKEQPQQPHVPGQVAAAVHGIIEARPAHVAPSSPAPVIAQPVGSPGWTEEIGNQVSWLANRSESRAELVLTPPQMGRIEVNLSVKGDQATASFVSSNPVVREALEAALPRLREVLADAGIQLGQTQVNAENPRQWAQQEKHGDNSGSDPVRATPVHEALSSASSGSLSTTSGLKGGRGLVDVFA
jgi:flagellar hook-length control protein FliK